MFKVVQFYFNRPGQARTTARGLTLEEAQAHCKDPETSFTTCTKPAARQRTRQLGPWFDGYEKE